MSKKKEPCSHEEYCGFSKTICETTDFQEHCRMKDASIEEMHLLGAVKERVERDHKYELEHEEELKKHAQMQENLKNTQK